MKKELPIGAAVAAVAFVLLLAIFIGWRTLSGQSGPQPIKPGDIKADVEAGATGRSGLSGRTRGSEPSAP